MSQAVLPAPLTSPFIRGVTGVLTERRVIFLKVRRKEESLGSACQVEASQIVEAGKKVPNLHLCAAQVGPGVISALPTGSSSSSETLGSVNCWEG